MKHLVTLLPAYLVAQMASAQLTVTDSLSASAIADMLLGDNLSIFNVTVNCAPGAIGQFVGLSEVPIEHGLVLTTGSADMLANPASALATTMVGTAGDMDLDAELMGMYPTYDACALEFDCIPEGDTLLFNFAFGSEEYPEYAGSAFNDIFAIYLSGPGFTPPQNVAAIPGGTTVSINNVNAFTNPMYYVDNENPPGQYVVYDGFTTNLTAFAVVTPSELYHFKVAIADVADAVFDSGVMLEAFSFRSLGFSTGIHDAALPNGPVARLNGDLLELAFLNDVVGARADLLDALGNTVGSFGVTNDHMSIGTGSLPAGAYMVRFARPGKVSVLRFMKD